MAKILSIITLCIELGTIAIHLLQAALRMYKDLVAQRNSASQEQFS